MSFVSNHIVSKHNSTVYEINVSHIKNIRSDYDCQYLVSLVNFGECFFERNLNFIAETIMLTTKKLSYIDAVNIQNAIAKNVSIMDGISVKNIDIVEFDPSSRRIVLG